MDVRTVLKFMQIDQAQFPFEGVKHNSVDDCRHDIKMVQRAYQLMNDWMTACTILEAKRDLDRFEAKSMENEPLRD
jgi:hypothetical protein